MTGRDEAAAWQPSLGAWPVAEGFRFRVWAPRYAAVSVVLDPDRPSRRQATLTRNPDGTFAATVPDVRAGTRYGYLLDGTGPFPDPVSRAQPEGVHGWSLTVAPEAYAWSDGTWRGVPIERAIFYELHVGTFSREGTFAGVTKRLPYLADLGVTVVELMPVADFPGSRNWGYDGVALFAPSRCYGTPDDLRVLVDTAHALGLAVVLDVVYNHFGPDGAYAFTYSPYYASARHTSPWGAAMNFDGEESAQVRAFVAENALHWLHEYHLDGLRLDATHTIRDDSPRHIVADVVERARLSLPHRTLLLVAEDERNLTSVLHPSGWALDAVWADDFHHQMRRLAAGDRDGYFADYTGTVRDLAVTIERGWFYAGQHSVYRDARHGTAPDDVPRYRMVVALQNHDQVGNRALGERLNRHIDARLLRALVVLWLCAPETPLLFMGQEWAASTPFLYFTDHQGDLGRAVTEGRRREFSRFAAFTDEALEAIPDPQAPSTFTASQLRWREAAEPGHRGVLALYRVLLHLRHTEPALQSTAPCAVEVLDDDVLAIRRNAESETLVAIVRVRGSGEISVPGRSDPDGMAAWSVVLMSDARAFAESAGAATASPPEVAFSSGTALIDFQGPSAVILRQS